MPIVLPFRLYYAVDQDSTERYAFGIRAVKSGEEWILMHVDMYTTPPFSMEYRQWTRRAYEKALQAAGFQDIRWHPFEISTEGMARFGAPYWEPFLKNPLCIALTARR